MDRKEEKGHGVHVLALPYPSQGHINPMLQFCKRLVSKGLKATFVITKFISKSMHPNFNSVIGIDTISDGYDQGGFTQAESIEAYLETLRDAGSTTLAELINKYKNTAHPIDCVIYDAFLPWALDVTKEHGLVGAAFFTQPCSVNYVYYQVYHGLLTVPIPSLPVSIPGLPLVLQLEDMPSFVYVYGSYPAYFKLVLNQFLNVDKADYIFVNTFYKLEDEVLDTMSKIKPLVTIGPTIPSFYMDNRLEYDRDYGFNLFDDLDSSSCTNWLSAKPIGSVIYVSFGSMANLAQEQMEELAWGLKESNNYFLWVIRTSEEEKKLPKELIEETGEKGLLVRWSPQLEVLSSKAMGCFFSHGGWNSTIEALSLGVPMIVMPQWTDQTMNAKLVQDFWKIGIRVKVDENGLVGRDEIKRCLTEIMEKEGGKEMKLNAMKWRDLAIEAISEGGTSDKNMDEFVYKLTN